MFFVFLLSGCEEDKSEVSSGAGSSTGIVSDGGAASAAYSGVYFGEMTIVMNGDILRTRTITRDATVVIGSDGTGSLITDGDRVSGTMNGSEFGFSIHIVDVKDLVECEGDALITGRFTGNIGAGSISGSGECKLLTLDEGFTMTGRLTVSR
ncbi:MAG: hypothetical protein GKR95_16905 [Gammaproteobacteria bacterium]|nr:hypothetical protein [Gammaproteobacteria bacterium]